MSATVVASAVAVAVALMVRAVSVMSSILELMSATVFCTLAAPAWMWATFCSMVRVLAPATR